MLRLFFAMGAFCALAACGEVAPDAPQTPADSTVGFTINDLLETDAQIQGCTRTLSRAGAPANAGAVFMEDGVDSGAKGFIRIDGALVAVDLVSSDAAETGGTRVFEDATHSVRIVETLQTGAAHEESDSVEESGSLEVMHNGATQTLQVVGGTAC